MRDRTKRRTLVTSCAILFAIGLLGSMIGPVLPDRARITRMDLASLGSIFSMLFLGSVVSQLAAGFLTDRMGHKPVLFVGLVLIATGFPGLSMGPSLPLVLVAAFVAGVGTGAVVVSVNLLVVQEFAESGVAALNLANVFYGIGAITGPSIVGLLLQNIQTGLPALWLTTAYVLVLIFFVTRLRLHRPVPSARPQTLMVEPARSVFSSPILWIFSGLLLLYVGTEIGTGGWMATYVNRSTALELGVAALVTSGFYLALTSGRLVASFLSGRLQGPRLLFVALCGTVLGSTILALGTGNLLLTIAGALVLGFCLGPVYPTAVALITSYFPTDTGKAGGIAMTVASLGGTTFPWLLGVLILQVSPRSGMLLLAGCALVMLLLCMFASAATSRLHAASAERRVFAGDRG